MSKLMTVLVASLFTLSTPVLAEAGKGVNERQHRQTHRIKDGVKSGELTKHETRGLVHEQRDIRKLEREYRSDGELTKDERKDLHQEQNQASRHIYKQKHDAQEQTSPGTKSPGVNTREHNQKARIKQGVRSGELTRAETKELVTEQKDIRALERDHKSDGSLTADERKDLHHQLNQASKEVYEEKHDDEARPKAQ
ncbi:MAG: hypothetical protein ACREV9_13325 [Burkholderiales bacterium]